MSRPIAPEQDTLKISNLLPDAGPDKWIHVVEDFQKAVDEAAKPSLGSQQNSLKNIKSALATRVHEGEGALYMAVALIHFVPFQNYESTVPIGRMLANLVKKENVPLELVDKAVAYLSASWCMQPEIEGILSGSSGLIDDPMVPSRQSLTSRTGYKSPEIEELSKKLFSVVEQDGDNEDYDVDSNKRFMELMGMAVSRGYSSGVSVDNLAAVVAAAVHKQITASGICASAEDDGMPIDAVLDMARSARDFLAGQLDDVALSVQELDEFLNQRLQVPGAAF